jgi:hypothetical protein
MDGPDYAKVPEYVKGYLRRGGDAFMSEGAPDLGKIRNPYFEDLARAAPCSSISKDGETLGTASRRCFYGALELLVSPKPELVTGRSTWWVPLRLIMACVAKGPGDREGTVTTNEDEDEMIGRRTIAGCLCTGHAGRQEIKWLTSTQSLLIRR